MDPSHTECRAVFSAAWAVAAPRPSHAPAASHLLQATSAARECCWPARPRPVGRRFAARANGWLPAPRAGLSATRGPPVPDCAGWAAASAGGWQQGAARLAHGLAAPGKWPGLVWSEGTRSDQARLHGRAWRGVWCCWAWPGLDWACTAGAGRCAATRPVPVPAGWLGPAERARLCAARPRLRAHVTRWRLAWAPREQAI